MRCRNYLIPYKNDNNIRSNTHSPTLNHEEGIPKIIWMLWLQGWDDAPEIARISRDCWARRNPDWRVQALTLESLCQFLPEDVVRDFTQISKPPEALANLIRIELLYRHGGVWADATTLCAAPLDDWLADAMHMGFFAFAQPGPDRMISNWFLAASKGSSIIRDWRREGLEYWKGRTERDIYFWHHRCFAWAYQKSAEFRDLWDKSPKIPAANQFHFGPDSGYLFAEPFKGIDDLLENPPVPVFKLTHKLSSPPNDKSLFARLMEYGKVDI